MSRGQFRDLPGADLSRTPSSSEESDDRCVRVWEDRVYGRVTRHYIRPGEYTTPVLAARLADKFVEVGAEIPGTMRELGTSIRGFLSSLGSQLHEVGGNDSFDLSDLRRRHLDVWEQSLLAAQRENPTETPYRHAVLLFALLRRINSDTRGCLHHEVADRLERQTRLVPKKGEGEPEFRLEEAEQLRETARRVVNEALIAHRGSLPLVAPPADVIVASHVLLSLGTGEPPEVLRRLRVDDIAATARPDRSGGLERLDRGAKLAELVRRHGVQSFCVRYVKARAAERYEQVYTRRDDKVFKPLSALITLTAAARAVSGLPNLWLVAEDDGSVVEPAWGRRPFTLRSWIDRVGLVAPDPSSGDVGFSEPVRFSRLRKSVATQEVLSDPARYLRSNRRHTARTFFQHYSNSGVLRAEAGRVLMQAVTELFEVAVSGPTIVTPAAEDLLAAGQHAPTIDRDTAERLVAGGLDTQVAACRDPCDSPHAPHGDLCPFSATGDCYACPNALITQHHLPAVLRWQDLLDPDATADMAFWRERWKLIHDFITLVILPAFPPAAIAAARDQMNTALVDIGLLNDLGVADVPT